MRRCGQVAAMVLFCFVATMAVMAGEPGTPKVRSEMLVSTDWLAEHLKDPNVVVLHVTRYRADYERGHVPGARYAPTYELISDKQELSYELPPVADLKRALESLGIGDRTRVVIYAPGTPQLATRIYFTFDYLGLGDRTSVLDGGLEKWKADKHELSTETPKFAAAKLTVKPRREIVATFAEVKKITESTDSPVVVVDSRPQQRYKDGHLPGAVSAFWVETIASRDLPTWKTPEEVQKFYESAGIKPGSKVITYCEVGQQATHGYFTAKYLGYDAKMYDGSYDEWSNGQNAPVVKGESRR